MNSTRIFCARRSRRHEGDPVHCAQGNPGGPAQSLGAGGDAAARGTVTVAHAARQRADWADRSLRARRGDRQPVEPDHLPAAADRAADLTRCHRRRDGARHDDPAAQLSGVARPCGARQILRPHRDPRLRHADRLWRRRGSVGAIGRSDRAGELAGVRLDARHLGVARRGVRRHRLCGVEPGSAARHRRRHRDRRLAAAGLGVRYGAARRAGG